jgi:hypothetical protein
VKLLLGDDVVVVSKTELVLEVEVPVTVRMAPQMFAFVAEAPNALLR